MREEQQEEVGGLIPGTLTVFRSTGAWLASCVRSPPCSLGTGKG